MAKLDPSYAKGSWQQASSPAAAHDADVDVSRCHEWHDATAGVLIRRRSPRACGAKAPPSAPPEPVPAVPDAEKYLNDRFARSTTFVRDVSVKELSMMVEKLEGSLDSSWTADLSKTGHLALIYICSRLKPGQKLTELSCLACSCKGCINWTFSHANEQEALSRFVCLQ